MCERPLFKEHELTKNQNFVFIFTHNIQGNNIFLMLNKLKGTDFHSNHETSYDL